MKYILSNETVKFEVANVKEDRNKYFEGGSIIPMPVNFLTKITSPKLKQVKKIST